MHPVRTRFGPSGAVLVGLLGAGLGGCQSSNPLFVAADLDAGEAASADARTNDGGAPRRDLGGGAGSPGDAQGSFPGSLDASSSPPADTRPTDGGASSSGGDGGPGVTPVDAPPVSEGDAGTQADGPAALPIGLVAWWAMDERTGNRVSDGSANHNDGTLVNVAYPQCWQSGKLGGALVLPGSGAVSVPASASLDAIRAITITAWVYRKSERSGWAVIVSRRSAGGGDSGLGFGFRDNRLAVSAAGNVFDADFATSLNRWYHVAETYDGSAVRLYVDGIERARSSASVPLKGSVTPIIIGATDDGGGPAQFLPGLLDDVRIYDRALTAAELATLAR